MKKFKLILKIFVPLLCISHSFYCFAINTGNGNQGDGYIL